MANVVDDHCIRRDFIHDQIFPNRKSQEAGLPCGSTDMRRSGNAHSRTFNSSDETACGLPIVRGYVLKNVSEIGKLLRWRCGRLWSARLVPLCLVGRAESQRGGYVIASCSNGSVSRPTRHLEFPGEYTYHQHIGSRQLDRLHV